MKKVIYSTIGIFALLVLSFFTSCKQEPCELVNCAYSGVCDEGSCICQVGYEGIHCETIARDKFIDNGIYSVNEDGTLSPQAQYTTTIEAGPLVNQIRLKNFRNFFTEDIIASVSHDTMWIAPQTFSNGYKVEGMGIITGKNPVGRHYYQDAIINISYKVTNIMTNAVDEYGSNGSQPSDWNKN